MDVTLKYAVFLKIGIVALNKERTILIVSKFQYTQCIGSRSIKLRSISRGRERSGSVVECLTRDQRAAGSSLTGVTALCP